MNWGSFLPFAAVATRRIEPIPDAPMFTAHGSAVASPPLAAAAQAQSLTRDQIIQLGRHGSPWTFAPLALRALVVAPADAGMRFLLAANLAKLMLRTPALGQLEALAADAARDPQLQALRHAIENLPADEISATERIAMTRSNVHALAARGVNLHAALHDWEQATRAERWFRTRSGNIVRLAGDPADPGAWRHLSDVRTGAEGFVTERLTAADARNGVVVEGADPPWLLMAVHQATAGTEDGFTPRIRFVQADERELLDGLACADLSRVIADERVSFHIGLKGADHLLADLRANLDAQFLGPHIGVNTLRTRVHPSVTALLETAACEQADEQQRLVEQVRRRYAGRDRAFWAQRFAEGLAAAEHIRNSPAAHEPGAPLRVLIPTYRHSTFVRHSADDIAAALVCRGIEARILMEPDDHTCINTLAHVRAVAEFEPDLLIVINYPRAQFGGAIPEGVPYVCWVQDAMPHLHTEEAGRDFGALEFLVGHTSDELFDRFGYPRERSLRLPVVASEEKFSIDPAPAHLLEKHECDVAYVSHHSETPEQMTQRLMREANDDRIASCVALIAERLPAEIAALTRAESRARMVACVRDVAAEVLGVSLNARTESHLLHGCALRLADRMLRHEMLAWTRAVCERRGWRLRLYGRGWDRHPTLAPYGCTPLEHGDDLRACYQAAKVHLHGTIHWNLHQRITECVLSGGVPLVRLKRDDLQIPYLWTLSQLPADGALQNAGGSDGSLPGGYLAIDHPSLVRYCLQLQRLGFGAEVTSALQPHPLTVEHARGIVRQLALDEHTAWLSGDMALTGFQSEAELEARLEAMIERPELRREISGGMRRRAMQSLTYTSAVSRILALITDSLRNQDASAAA